MSSFRLCKPIMRNFLKPCPQCTIKPVLPVFGNSSTSPHYTWFHPKSSTWFQLVSPGFTWFHLVSPGFTWFHLKPSINEANTMIGLAENPAAVSWWMICNPEIAIHFVEFEVDSCIEFFFFF